MSKKKVEKELEVKTYEEWAKELYDKEGIEILELDGFDRSNPNFMKEKYTKEEFEKGLMRSTIEQTKKAKEQDNIVRIFRGMIGNTPINTKEKVFTNIKKLKCNYTTYKEERTKYNMPVEEGKQGSCIICGNCAKGE